MIKSIKAICGVGGNLQDLEQIPNNPNFVFENDPLFSTITLYDIDRNVINVNSWVECAHYVNGGWSSIVQTGYVGTSILLQITVVLYLGFGIYKYVNQKKQ